MSQDELPSRTLATQHDGLPVWARPLARAPDGIGEEMGVSDILMHSLCLTFIRYMVLTHDLTASKSVDHISCVSDLPAHARTSHISFVFTTKVRGRSSSMSIHLWPCTTHSIPTSLFGPSWGCAGGLSYVSYMGIRARIPPI
jgi:hypothetical protein